MYVSANILSVACQFFAPSGTAVVEFVPKDERLGGRLMIFYTTRFLGNPYFRIQVDQVDAMVAPVDEIIAATREAIRATTSLELPDK